jgi:adenylate cyclase
MHILIVDDDLSTRTMLEQVVKYAGYETIMTSNAKDALDLLTKHTPQIILIDWMMPDMNGLELVKEIRQLYPEPYRYIMMITARDSNEDRVTGLSSGVDDYITKPFNTRELEARLRIGARIVQMQTTITETALQTQRTKQEWEATTDSISQLICLLDDEGRVIRANGTIEKWGLAWQSEAAGNPLHQLIANVYPDFAQKFHQDWPTAHNHLARGMDYRYECMDNQRGHHFSVNFEPINPFGDRSVEASSFAAVNIQDITEHKNLEKQLLDAKKQIEIENQKAHGLLLNTFPPVIAERLKEGETNIAESFDNVTVIFADLVGFTKLTDSTPPDKLIAMLNEIFSMFDDLTLQYGLEKIKTIGDAYMAVAGVPVSQSDHAARAANFALDLHNAIAYFNQGYELNLSVRVGIASGAVTAGVIGKFKYSYDLWGDTVNTASRMESHGIAGNIQITEDTYNLLLNDNYIFKAREDVVIKGKGKVKTYFLLSKRESPKPTT